MKKILFLSTLSFLLFLSSCYYDTEEALFPQLFLKGCDTSVFTYSGAIQPMLAANCLGCHSGTNSPNLASFGDVVTNATAIYGAITHTVSNPMPLNSSKLDNCYIIQFKRWMDAGKQQN